MDITAIIETVTPISLAYFFLGGLAGYFFRANLSSFRGGRRPGRYETIRAGTSTKRSAGSVDPDEPKFELPDSVLKSLTPRRLDSLSIDENVSEF